MMTENSVPKVVVDEKVEIAVSVVGILMACVATYYVAKTGNWEPLSAISMGLALTVLFVTSKK